MNIDLLFTRGHEPGLVCDCGFSASPVAVLFGCEDRLLRLAIPESPDFLFNIPVEDPFVEALALCHSVQLGIVEGGHVTGSHQLSLLISQESQDSESGSLEKTPSAGHSPLSFERFIRSCVYGQPVHRDNPGDEATLGAIMDSTMRLAPQFSPQLARQRVLESAPRNPQNAPHFSVPRMGAGGGAGTGGRHRGGEKED